MKVKIKGYIVPKESEQFVDCADRFDFDKDLNKFAISDGVSKSFFPDIWAEELIKEWVHSECIDVTQVIPIAQRNWFNSVTKLVERPKAKWWTKNAYNRKEPGLATFVGLSFFKAEDTKNWRWKAQALGDSFLFFIPKKFEEIDNTIEKISSKKEPIEFDNYPDYFSSIQTKYKGDIFLIEKELEKEGTFFLMTDALAEWFLNEQVNALYEIGRWGSQKDFEKFIKEERSSGRLGDDDTAVLIIEVENDGNEELTYESINVSDINELIEREKGKIPDSELTISKSEKENELDLDGKQPKDESPKTGIIPFVKEKFNQIMGVGFESLNNVKEKSVSDVSTNSSNELNEINENLEAERINNDSKIEKEPFEQTKVTLDSTNLNNEDEVSSTVEAGDSKHLSINDGSVSNESISNTIELSIYNIGTTEVDKEGTKQNIEGQEIISRYSNETEKGNETLSTENSSKVDTKNVSNSKELSTDELDTTEEENKETLKGEIYSTEIQNASEKSDRITKSLSDEKKDKKINQSPQSTINKF